MIEKDDKLLYLLRSTSEEQLSIWTNEMNLSIFLFDGIVSVN